MRIFRFVSPTAKHETHRIIILSVIAHKKKEITHEFSSSSNRRCQTHSVLFIFFTVDARPSNANNKRSPMWRARVIFRWKKAMGAKSMLHASSIRQSYTKELPSYTSSTVPGTSRTRSAIFVAHRVLHRINSLLFCASLYFR